MRIDNSRAREVHAAMMRCAVCHGRVQLHHSYAPGVAVRFTHESARSKSGGNTLQRFVHDRADRPQRVTARNPRLAAHMGPNIAAAHLDALKSL
jgi:hypothetical protein